MAVKDFLMPVIICSAGASRRQSHLNRQSGQSVASRILLSIVLRTLQSGNSALVFSALPKHDVEAPIFVAENAPELFRPILLTRVPITEVGVRARGRFGGRSVQQEFGDAESAASQCIREPADQRHPNACGRRGGRGRDSAQRDPMDCVASRAPGEFRAVRRDGRRENSAAAAGKEICSGFGHARKTG